MTPKIKKPCAFPGCPNLIDLDLSPYCQEHKYYKTLSYDKNRETATKRGYNTRWKKARRIFLNNNPLCSYCGQEGRVTPANEVDHFIPRKGDDPRFWDESNWRASCKSCHSSKTATQDNGFGRNSIKKPKVNGNRKPETKAIY